mmetsp:Transcript_8531/g.24476  ORF Transcript_8531/g.24476 Transcript_8531/m.24476 type:complete len:399 (+) Transcript_8531:285-1481(+)
MNPGPARGGPRLCPCGRRANPAIGVDGRPYEHCCRACALGGRGQVHDPGCDNSPSGLYSSGETSTVVGIALSHLCGDVLGTCVIGVPEEQIHRRFPTGLRELQRSRRHGYGCYSDCAQLSLATMISLIARQTVDAEHMAQCFCDIYDEARGYGQRISELVELLKSNQVTYLESGRWNLPEGSHGNGGAVRVAPIGFVYRYCDNETLRDAVEAALLCTHVHPTAIDSACIQAAAVALISRTRIRVEGGDVDSDVSPADLLAKLKDLSRTSEMREKLELVIDGLEKWTQQGPSLALCSDVRRSLSDPFQVKGTEAVACALWAVCTSWENPREAIIRAVMFGGAANSIGAMTGALVGARHGWSWIPVGWFNNLENGGGIGRDAIMRTAAELTLIPTPPSIT